MCLTLNCLDSERMSNQQVVAPRASANGFGPRRGERDNKPHSSAKSSGVY